MLYKINIDIKSLQVKENIIEVLTTLSLNPTKDNFERIENTRFVIKSFDNEIFENVFKELFRF